VIVEPVGANMGLVPPAPGFLEGVRAACDRSGALLIFDEVITGFRVAYGGAQETSGVVADLTTFGKVIGGGLNIGAYGGRRDVMHQVAPLGPVYQAGTLSGNPVATAAGLAVLELLDANAYVVLAAKARRLADGLRKAIETAGLPIDVPVVGPLLGLHFSTRPAVDYVTARTTDEALYGAFFHAMLRRGVALAPGPYEIAFPGLAHSDDDIDDVIGAAEEAAVEVAERRSA
jgi:glutamate-1-semialdehyde 2,1-aminomutase